MYKVPLCNFELTVKLWPPRFSVAAHAVAVVSITVSNVMAALEISLLIV
jgi:hypothetical protein